MILTNFSSFAQGGYDYISDFGEFQKHWALVQSDGLFGFIDNEGNEVVAP